MIDVKNIVIWSKGNNLKIWMWKALGTEGKYDFRMLFSSVSTAGCIQIFGLLPLDQITMFLTSIMHSDINSVHRKAVLFIELKNFIANNPLSSNQNQ